MSYILEALKKLEEKRRGETDPFRLSAQYSGPQNRKEHFPWGYLMIFALLMNAGIFLWWLHPWRAGKTVETGVVNRQEKAPPHGSQDFAGEANDDRPGYHLRQRQAGMKTQGNLSAGTGDSAPKVVSQTPRPVPDDMGRDKKIIGINELPVSVRQKLPDLTISGHFYDSRPSFRIGTVGGRTLHEGVAAAPGVILEQITPDGAVFSCEGYRFRKGVF